MKGKFITFEGGEGSGKTTQSKMLYDRLIKEGIGCIWTREIGGTKTAEQIREIILSQDLNQTAELLLIMAARFEHVQKVIKPALFKGQTVICDRFIDSTMSYQDMDLALKLHRDIFGSFMPDITFFIDLEPEIALNRAISRGDANKFEDKDMAFHKRVYDNFKLLASKFDDRIISVSGQGGIDEIGNRILIAIDL
jgi:dTMP kinase